MYRTYVYLIRQGNGKGGPIKIGVARKPEQRLGELQTANPYKLYILVKIPCNSTKAAYELEQKLHKKFQKYKMQGEWFQGRIIRMIDDLETHETHYIDKEYSAHWYSI